MKEIDILRDIDLELDVRHLENEVRKDQLPTKSKRKIVVKNPKDRPVKKGKGNEKRV